MIYSNVDINKEIKNLVNVIVNNLKAIFFQNPEEKLNGADFIVYWSQKAPFVFLLLLKRRIEKRRNKK